MATLTAYKSFNSTDLYITDPYIQGGGNLDVYTPKSIITSDDYDYYSIAITGSNFKSLGGVASGNIASIKGILNPMASYIYWEIKGEFDLTSYDLYLSDSVTTLNNYIFSGSDSVYGSTLDDYIDLPDYGVDNIFADNGNDFIVTNYGLDSGNVSGYVSGGAGNDLIWSHGKKDILEGDNGSDIFEFNATNSNTAIFDFEPEVDALNIIISDKMNGLSSKLSTGYLDNGEQYFYLTENQIYAKPGAKKAKDYDDLIVYNTKTGVVFFDSDGKGGSVPVKIVQLIGSPDLDAEDLAKIITLGISGHDSSDTIDNYWFSTYGMPGSY